jgi:FkbM family methyltransferase
LEFEDFLHGFFRGVDTEHFYFIQVGANDGKFRDPIHRFVRGLGLKGLLLEPNPDMFTRLQSVYHGQTQLCLLNVAVDARDGTRTFYRFNDAVIEQWPDAQGMAGFDKGVLRVALSRQRAHVSAMADPIEAIEVVTRCFESIRAEAGFDRVDLLQVDVEGFDLEVLKLFDFGQFAPAVVNYEHRHLSDAARIESWKLMKSLGYRVVIHGGDTLAFRPVT